MKLQLVTYKAEKESPWGFGVAFLPSFGMHDIDFIVTAHGERLPAVWDYKLLEGPMAYLSNEHFV